MDLSELYAHAEKPRRIRFMVAAAVLVAWIAALAVLAVTTSQRPRPPAANAAR
jgi:hypothetical protein